MPRCGVKKLLQMRYAGNHRFICREYRLLACVYFVECGIKICYPKSNIFWYIDHNCTLDYMVEGKQRMHICYKRLIAWLYWENIAICVDYGAGHAHSYANVPQELLFALLKVNCHPVILARKLTKLVPIPARSDIRYCTLL